MPMKRLRQLNTTDNLWVYVLRILMDSPTHAYSIREEVRKRFGFRPGTVTAYKVLYLLGKSGLVEKRLEGRQKVYTITPKGEKALGDAIAFYRERAKVLE
jgi:PadR family transcriptional regulator, regulatory protein PadR